MSDKQDREGRAEIRLTERGKENRPPKESGMKNQRTQLLQGSDLPARTASAIVPCLITLDRAKDLQSGIE